MSTRTPRSRVRFRRSCIAAVLAVLTAAGGAACSSASDGSAADTSTTSAEHDQHGAEITVPPAGALSPGIHTGPQGRVGQFVTDCGYSHSAPDDPIVYPGEPGKSHMHDFFGNTTADADSTLESLHGGDTTCQKRLDRASYWTPALLDHGKKVEPTKSTAYYRAAPGVDPTEVVAFPQGLAIIAGDMTLTDPGPEGVAAWTCGNSTRRNATPPECPRAAPLRAVITFPDCWDGTNADSIDHRSHMANSDRGECPPSHPEHVPQLTFAVSYPIWGTGHDLSLVSGEIYGLHSDFLNAWDEEGLEGEIEGCLHRDLICGLSSNRGQEPLFSG